MWDFSDAAPVNSIGAEPDGTESADGCQCPLVTNHVIES